MDIVIVSQYLRNIEDFEGNNSRFVYLAKLLTEDTNNEVEIITSDFHHATKTHFSNIGELKGVKITALHEKGYPKNVSLKRFGSHKELSKNISKYLNNRKKPDVIYCAVPSLDVGKMVARYCNKNNVEFIIDIQDLWPEAFQMVFNVPVLSDLIFYPMKKQADFIYKSADKIVAVSQTYVNRAISVNKKAKKRYSIYLGTKLKQFDSYGCEKKQSDRIKLVYIGTLGHSYDLCLFFDAIDILQKKYKNIECIVMGDGPLLNKFKEKAKSLNINVNFTGSLDYGIMVSKLRSCDIALNPIAKGAAQSIINKVGDYAAAGLPVISTQECEEYRNLLSSYHCGFTCEYSAQDIANKIEYLINDSNLRLQMSKNSRLLAVEKFDRERTYSKIVQLINQSINSE